VLDVGDVDDDGWGRRARAGTGSRLGSWTALDLDELDATRPGLVFVLDGWVVSGSVAAVTPAR
jgi:hypothetical protein